LKQDVVAVLEDWRPPMPVAIEAPILSASAAISMPESCSAWRAAARTICAKRSMRRADLWSIHVVG